jgi:penicillin amidase
MKLRLVFWFSLLLLLTWALNRRWGMIPAVGEVLSVHQGLWHTLLVSQGVESQQIKGLQGPVQIAWDQHNMPHVFAKSDHDVYFAQGYLMARDRLWQMEFQVRVAQGRLSELIGPRTLPVDRFFIQLQLEEAAERSLELIRQDPASWGVLEAFTRGVNARIRELTPESRPLEYKLLGVQPQRWRETHSILVQKLMAFRLSAFGKDVHRTRTAQKLGYELFNELFPFFPSNLVSTYALNEYQSADLVSIYPKSFWPDSGLNLPEFTGVSLGGGEGSNAWAVSAKHSASKFALLANDPHLFYSLPSIWYPIHLQTEEMDVIGYAVAGTPGVVIGSTSKLAWGVTNGYADVMDWYTMKYRDETQTEYLHRGRWEKVRVKSKLIQVRGYLPEEVRVRWASWGPIVSVGGLPGFASSFVAGLGFRWTGHMASNEVRTFYMLNRAEGIEDCPEALKYFVAPAQNFMCADGSGRVGAWLGGLIPQKAMGQGRLVMDSSNPNHHWRGFIDQKLMPQNVDPAQGYVFTANQRSIHPRYKFELGDEYPQHYRAQALETALEQKSRWDIEDTAALQGSMFDGFLCEFKRAVGPRLAKMDLQKVGAAVHPYLQDWDCKMAEDSIAATVFHTWWEKLYAEVWTTVIGRTGLYAWPDKTHTLSLLKGKHKILNESQWQNLLKNSLGSVFVDLQKNFGNDFARWRWGRAQKGVLHHVSRIPGLSRDVVVGGSGDSLMAHQGDRGPSMRFIARMEERPAIYMILPGGLSGDPASMQYNDWTKSWEEQKHLEVPFLKDARQAQLRGFDIVELAP